VYKRQIQVQLNLLDSHDTTRFLTVASGDTDALKLAYFFLMTYIGAPYIYYGDEIGMDGGPDPECRKSFNWDEKAWNHDLRNYLKELILVRKDEDALRRGTYQRLYSDADVIVYARQYRQETLLIAINTAASEKKPLIDVGKLGIKNAMLQPLFGSTSIAVKDGSDGLISDLRIGGRSGLILKVQ